MKPFSWSNSCYHTSIFSKKSFKMNISIFTKKLKLILSETKSNKLGKETKFTQRQRNITAFQLVTAMTCALGDKKTDYLSDILRYFNRLTDQNIRYKPFHNQLSKPELTVLMQEVTDKVFTHWINNACSTKKVIFQILIKCLFRMVALFQSKSV